MDNLDCLSMDQLLSRIFRINSLLGDSVRLDQQLLLELESVIMSMRTTSLHHHSQECYNRDEETLEAST